MSSRMIFGHRRDDRERMAGDLLLRAMESQPCDSRMQPDSFGDPQSCTGCRGISVAFTEPGLGALPFRRRERSEWNVPNR